MRQAITTKFFGPTNFNGARIRVKCDAKTIFVPWDHALNVEQNHVQAANELFCRMKWNRDGVLLRGGGIGNQYVFVQVEEY